MRSCFVILGALVLAPASAAWADDEPKSTVNDKPSADDKKSTLDTQLFATLSFGKGLRFNNPYRLATELGSDASSLSVTAAYVDFGANATFGAPRGLQHGVAVHAGVSMEGVRQAYLSGSYELAFRRYASWMVHARLGPSILLSPDVNVGGEIASGFSGFVTGGLGFTSELSFDLFYGAATLDRKYTTIPVLSLQIGVIADLELLP